MNPTFDHFSVRKILTDVFKNPLFIAALGAKVICSFLFASDYLAELFAPFVNGAVSGGNFFSVYDRFYRVQPDAFPYPPMMLYLLYLPRLVLSIFFPVTSTIGPIDLFAIRIPLLLSDVLLVVVLAKWIRDIRKVVIWYWLNPIVFYVCYIHGQLDLIPTALLCLSLFYLFQKRDWQFVIFYGLAIATKFHIVATFPLIVVYLHKNKRLDISFALRHGIGLALLILALHFPFILHEGFVKMVYQNKEQGKVFATAFQLFDEYSILMIPLSYTILLYVMWGFKIINKEILLIFLALSYGVITFFVVPNQGWHIWNIPFFIYCITRFNVETRALFGLLNIFYFIFFIVSPKSDFPLVAQFLNPDFKTAPNLSMWFEANGINSRLITNLSYTFLQGTLVFLCFALVRQGISKMRRHKIYFTPYLIGIGGDSGSGKSTLAEAVTGLFGSQNILIVKGDDMHRWERGHEKWDEITHLNPKANWLHQDISDLIDLKSGKRILRRSYDHATGKFTEPKPVNPERIIIYEGLHSFYLSDSGKIYDLKIFMNPSEELRRQWKINRDVRDRGHSVSKVLGDIEKRMPDSTKHIANQASEADIIFSIVEMNPGNREGESEKFSIRINSSNDIYFEKLLDELMNIADVKVRHDIERTHQEIEISGCLSAHQVERIADSLKLNLDEIIGCPPVWSGNNLGVMQLFILYYFFTQLKNSDATLAN